MLKALLRSCEVIISISMASMPPRNIKASTRRCAHQDSSGSRTRIPYATTNPSLKIEPKRLTSQPSTQKIFNSNPQVLVFIPTSHGPPTKTLQAIAREFNLFQTAFLHLNKNENDPISNSFVAHPYLHRHLFAPLRRPPNHARPSQRRAKGPVAHPGGYV
jgi:hypothetical protein